MVTKQRKMKRSAVARVGFLAAVVLLLFLLPSMAFASPIYVVHGANGKKIFTTRVPRNGSSYYVLPTNRFKRAHFSRIGRRGWSASPIAKSQFDHIIVKTAKANDLEPALVKSVIHAESAFNPRAVSPKGAVGLMQLMPQTARRFGVANSFNVEDNIAGGVRYLRVLSDRYRGNLRLILAAYNSGEHSVDRYGGIPPYRETQVYVTRVLTLLERYRALQRKA